MVPGSVSFIIRISPVVIRDPHPSFSKDEDSMALDFYSLHAEASNTEIGQQYEVVKWWIERGAKPNWAAISIPVSQAPDMKTTPFTLTYKH